MVTACRGNCEASWRQISYTYSTVASCMILCEFVNEERKENSGLSGGGKLLD